ncbi:MAG: radical SAM protein [Nitrospirae bacterium]|nr:radical SAM protein [Nitrospirota bacterium]
MGVYHITYVTELKEICLYFDGECQFSCHGCITHWHPEDCHLEESASLVKHQGINIDKVIAYLRRLSFKRVIFLGKEPTQDMDFLPLAKILKEKFSTYNIFLTNGWRYINDKALDEVCVSIKAITPQVFKDFTGMDKPERVLENFRRYVTTHHIKVRAESVLIPNYIDEREIENIACFISRVNKTIPYRIDAYIPFDNDRFPRPTTDEMNKVKAIAQKYLENVYVLHNGVKVRYPVTRIY